jgi:hypothetical protein
MPAYATRDDFEAYVEGWETTNPAALDRLLERASRDIDQALGPRAVYTAGTYTGWKLDPTVLQSWEREALARATCAQAEYRFETGERDLVTGEGGDSVSGPDFSITRPATMGGGRPRYGAKVAGELDAIAHLRVLTARMR